MKTNKIQQTKLMGVKHNQPKIAKNQVVEEVSNYLPNGINDILGLNNSVSSDIDIDYMKFIVEKTN